MSPRAVFGNMQGSDAQKVYGRFDVFLDLKDTGK